MKTVLRWWNRHTHTENLNDLRADPSLVIELLLAFLPDIQLLT